MNTYSIENEYIKIEFLTKGATVVSIRKKETNTEYILSYKNIDRYVNNVYYFGATIGRNAGRTYPTEYTNFSGNKVKLKPNENKVYLHGGEHGLDSVEWKISILEPDFALLEYTDTNSSYEKASINLVYQLIGKNFVVRYFGDAKTPTIFNLTNHSYFNLNGNRKCSTVKNHYLKIEESDLQIVDDDFIPTEKYSEMKNEYQNFDFSSGKKIIEAFNADNDLSRKCKGGIDLAYCFKKNVITTPKIEIWSENRKNGLRIYSNQESCVIYTLNKLIDSEEEFQKYQGITFEMQKRPNYIHSSPGDYLQNNYYNYIRYEIL